MRVIWRKIWRDMVHNKARTLMVVLSIAVGVFALGTIFGAHSAIGERLAQSHQAWIPVHITFWGWPFDQAVEDVVLHEAAVADAERLIDTSMRWKLEGETDWRDADLYARQDYAAQRIGRVELRQGAWPTDRTLAVENQTYRHFDIPLGSTVIVQVGRRERRLQVVGVVRDPDAGPPQFGDEPVFFTTPDTAAWLNGAYFNRIDVRLASYESMEDARQVIDQLAERVERVGMSVSVYGRWLRDPDGHWFQEDVDTVYVILMVLGGLGLGLSAFLIVNTMNAIVSQQVWQIGVMKVVGATVGRVVSVYLLTALIYGGLALLLAVPLGALGAHLLARWILDIVNVAAGPLRFSPGAVGIQIVVGLCVPLLAALAPVAGGARITAHRAIGTYGLGGGFGRGWFDRLIGHVRLPRPTALSLRNTFRRKARVLLTLSTLVLGGAMFIMVMSVGESLDNTLDVLFQDFGDDVSVWCNRPYHVDRLIEVAESVPGVVDAEVWQRYGTMIKLTGGGERYIGLWAVPPDSEMVHPRIVSGRALLPDDERAIVLSHKIALDEGFQVGDEVRFDVAGEETVWTVVGLVRSARDEADSFVPFDALTRALGRFNRGNNVRVASTRHDAESQQRLLSELNDAYNARNMELGYVESASQVRADRRGGFDIVLYLLLAMAILFAVVGSIGLMGTMSINVIERRREIGVMRATGATSHAIAGIFVVEGVLLGLLSWLFAVPLSYPGSRLFSDVVSDVLFAVPFEFVYSVRGMVLWLVSVALLSAAASLWPALRATQISVRESLAYE
jgi:putative ABC transport system permease protein